LRALLDSLRGDFQPRGAASAAGSGVADAELAAWRAVATTLLNLDETISKP
jgi:hypothetical protein